MKTILSVLTLMLVLVGQGALMGAAAQSRTKKDYYATLGVSKTASTAEISRAWRQKQLQHHPDRNKSNNLDGIDEDDQEIQTLSKEHTEALNEAYEVLKDAKKRSIYDLGGYEALAKSEEAEVEANQKRNAQGDNSDQEERESYDITLVNGFNDFWQFRLQAEGPYISKTVSEYLSRQTIPQLLEENKGKPVILVLVPLVKPTYTADGLDLCCAHVYEAHRFNQYISTERHTATQEGPRKEILRFVGVLPNDPTKPFTAEPIYIELNPNATQCTYLCSLHELTEQGTAGKRLRSQFQDNYGKPDFNYEEKMSQISCSNINLGKVEIPKAAALKPGTRSYIKNLLFLTLIRFTQGAFNNWVGRRLNANNASFVHAPWREWGTAALAYILQLSLCDKTFSTRACASGSARFLTLVNILGTGAQMLGEVIPLSKSYTSYRTVAPNAGAILTTFSALTWAAFR